MVVHLIDINKHLIMCQKRPHFVRSSLVQLKMEPNTVWLFACRDRCVNQIQIRLYSSREGETFGQNVNSIKNVNLSSVLEVLERQLQLALYFL